MRYRGPGQARQNFASQLITAGAPLEWIIHQMGHTTEHMLRERYAAWIASDAADLRSLVERKLGL